MSITITEILGTDSISASRIVINDNFNILKDEINSIQVYLDPNAGTISNLNSIEGLILNIGNPGNYTLSASQSGIQLNADSVFNGNITINGIIRNSSFSILNEVNFPGGIATVDPITGFSNYMILHSSTSQFNIELNEGEIGQIITFAVEQKGSADIKITAGGNTTFVLDSTNNDIVLNEIGSTVTLKYMLDSNGNNSWFIVGSNNITLE